MKQKLTKVIFTALLLGFFFSFNSAAWSFQKQTPSQIGMDQIRSAFSSEQKIDSIFCPIQNDDGTPSWYFSKFDSGVGYAVYMDPAKCPNQPTYPFRITDVHFHLFHNPTGWSWPVDIQVNILGVKEGNKCLGPDPLILLFSQSFAIPIDSSDDSLLGRPMNLTLNPSVRVSQPFFLEIRYLDQLVPGDSLPSLLMDAVITSGDTCNNWLRWTDGNYYEWSDAWESPPPGDAIIRATGYTNASAVEDEEDNLIPQDFKLQQNHPNPFNPVTSIQYIVGSKQRKAADGGKWTADGSSIHTTLVIYNILGQKVRTLVDESKRGGRYEAVWDGKDEKGNDLASGVYFYQLKAGEITQTKRLVLLR